MNPQLVWHYGVMASGKSSMALALNHNLVTCGRVGLLLTRQDRAGAPVISSRMGITAKAIEVTDTVNLTDLVTAASATAVATGGAPVTFVIADECQFYSLDQVEQLADIVDHLGIPVFAFGLATDFASALFPASRRLFELADEHRPLPVPAMCWCGHPARMNARLVDGVMVTEGDQVVIGDTSGAGSVTYRLLCRVHYRTGQHAAPITVADAPPLTSRSVGARA